MERVWQILQEASSAEAGFSAQDILLSLLLAFVLGQTLAWVYYYTHSGLSYSKSFVQSIILITVVVSMVMSTIAGSFIVAVGLMGALSIIRFRNIIKDTLPWKRRAAFSSALVWQRPRTLERRRDLTDGRIVAPGDR